MCQKNGFLERADTSTRDASRNYKLKSTKTEIFKLFQDSHKETLSIVLVMSHQIGSRTPRRDTYVGFCMYKED